MKATRWAVLFLCFLLITPVQAAEPKSALLMDAATGTVLYESNPHERLAPASVTKVMTLLLIMEAIDSGRIGWEDTERLLYELAESI